MLAPMRISVPTMRPKGEVRGQVVLLESCGSPAHDEAALHAMRAAKFAPHLVDGTPADVTVVVPLHLPRSRSAPAS